MIYLSQVPAFDPRARYLTGMPRRRRGLGAFDPRKRYLTGLADPFTDLQNMMVATASQTATEQGPTQSTTFDSSSPAVPPITIVLSPTSGPIPPPEAVRAGQVQAVPSIFDQQFIQGLPNKYLFLAGAGVLLLSSLGGRRRR